jgi:hypothetical protein
VPLSGLYAEAMPGSRWTAERCVTLADMERVWVFDHLAICVTRVDFLDPAVAGEPDARERGVRIEIRPVTTTSGGSIYASDATTLRPAICRIDFLESAPGAADRMHWHPTMQGGEPGDRTFEPEMPRDPVGWLTAFLREELRDFLVRSGVPDAPAMVGELETIRSAADEIGLAVRDGLAWAREPWPEVEHDARGMAAVR